MLIHTLRFLHSTDIAINTVQATLYTLQGFEGLFDVYRIYLQ